MRKIKCAHPRRRNIATKREKMTTGDIKIVRNYWNEFQFLTTKAESPKTEMEKLV